MKKIFVVTAGEFQSSWWQEVADEDLLPTLQGLVGGSVEPINLLKDMTLWVNEEGKMLNLPFNYFATKMWEKKFGVGTDYIVGDVVITGYADGDTTGLKDEIIKMLQIIFDREMDFYEKEKTDELAWRMKIETQ